MWQPVDTLLAAATTSCVNCLYRLPNLQGAYCWDADNNKYIDYGERGRAVHCFAPWPFVLPLCSFTAPPAAFSKHPTCAHGAS